MKKIIICIFIIIVFIVTIIFLMPQQKYKGISTTITMNTTTKNLEENLDKFKNISASVSLCVMEYINKPTDSTIISIPDWQVKIDTFMKITNKKNIKVEMLKPHIGTYSNGDSFSRDGYNPKNKDLFFANWESILLRYANYCNTYHIPLLAIECEMSRLTTVEYYSNWEKIIKDIKSRYPNLKVTTAFRTSDLQREIYYKEKGSKSILDLTDYIGYNFYPILQKNEPNKIPLEYDNMINDAYNLWHEKILITESGSTPWSNAGSNKLYPVYIPQNKNKPYNFTNQNIFLNTILKYVLSNDKIAGVFLWHTDRPFNFLDNNKNYNLVKKYFGTKR